MFKPILRLFVIILLVFIFGYSYSAGNIDLFLPAFLLISCIPGIPCIFLFIEYFIVTRNQTVEITSESISIKYNEGKSTYYPITELEVIKLYKSKGMEKGNFPYATQEMFYHAEIFTKSGERLILTCFLGPHFDDALDLLKDVKKEIKRSFFSAIYW